MISNSSTLSVAELIEKQVLFIGDGYRAKNSEFGTAGIPFVRIGNLSDNGEIDLSGADLLPEKALHKVGNKVSQPGDIIFTSKGSVGRFIFVRADTPQFVYSPQLSFWRVLNDKLMVPRFLIYWMQGLEFQQQIHGLKSQTDMADYVSLSDQRRMMITLPPFLIQRRIAEILGRLDDKIEVNRRINRTLEAMAQALYKHWFMDFGPFQDGEFTESELGLIPKGWTVGRLQDIADIIMGASPNGESYNQEGMGIPLINGPVEFGDYFPIKSKWTTEPLKLSKKSDLILCVRGSTTGRRVTADDAYCLGRGVCAIRSRDLNQAYVNYTLHYRLQNLLSYTTGSVFPSLSSSDIRELSILMPPDSLIKKYCRLVNPMLLQIGHNIQTASKLSEIRDYLLPKLLSGSIPLHIAEQAVEYGE